MTPEQFTGAQEMLTKINQAGNELKELEKKVEDVENVLNRTFSKGANDLKLENILGNPKEIN